MRQLSFSLLNDADPDGAQTHAKLTKLIVVNDHYAAVGVHFQ
jgi:hypothetical protein